MSPNSRIWRAGIGIVAVGALAAACAPGTHAAPTVAPAVQTTTAVTPAAAVTPATVATPVAPVAPAAAATQDPQVTADTQAADRTLSQIETDLSTMDQATNSGENDVPSN